MAAVALAAVISAATAGDLAPWSTWAAAVTMAPLQQIMGPLHSERLSADLPSVRHDQAECFVTVLGLIAQASLSAFSLAPDARAMFVKASNEGDRLPQLSIEPARRPRLISTPASW